ncbi:hypothetical protein K7X08_030085 [Anisodus acutangulus]|uniref:Calmodulin-binding domain-containing protein n=1 Tax=Anisodus acutangulus TaxID=402998 RepID=A0A9Q1LLE9_9SOLA|nr:hypothetical protein K7X08_030085 [Anisodus acutangulus]
MNKLSKAPHPSYKDVVLKQHDAGLYARAVGINNTITRKQDSPVCLTPKAFIMTSNLIDIVENIDPHEGEELEQEEHQELVIEDHEELSDIVNIDEYLKASESSSLYVMENQEVVKMEIPEEQLLVEETSIIKNHKEVEEIKNLEPSNIDLEAIEKQESVITTQNENQEDKEKGEESAILVKALDDCEKDKEEGKELDLNIDQEEKEESKGINNKGKKENNNKISTTTMAFAKAYPHLVKGNNNSKKESVVSNDVIEETASKLREQRKNRVKALASAFETVISLQDPK